MPLNAVSCARRAGTSSRVCFQNGVFLRSSQEGQSLVRSEQPGPVRLKIIQDGLSLIRIKWLNRICDQRDAATATQQSLDRTANAIFCRHSKNHKSRRDCGFRSQKIKKNIRVGIVENIQRVLFQDDLLASQEITGK